MAALISGHPVQKSIAIHFHPCYSVLRPQNAGSILFCKTSFMNFIRVRGDICQYNVEIRK